MTSISETVLRLKSVLPFLQNIPAKDVPGAIIDCILKTPYEKADTKTIQTIFGEDYSPGLFYLAERRKRPDFLLEESKVEYEEWVRYKVEAELSVLEKSDDFAKCILQNGKENIKDDLYNMLSFKTKEQRRLDEIISNQEYSDFFRRILMLLLKGDAFSIYHNHDEFNRLGLKIAVGVLEKTVDYTLYERLIQTIVSGLVGVDMKENQINTSPASLSKIIPLGTDETDLQKIDRVFMTLDSFAKRKNVLQIDCYKRYLNEVLRSNGKTICWFFDDYIQTVFELKFIEEQMELNESLFFYLIPRYRNYSNDASYDDVMNMINLDILKRLKGFSGRMEVCRQGMDMSTVDGLRISKSVADIMLKSDIVVMTGARAYEMSQGIKKITYFTGIAVCKGYTESITGYSKDSGALIFLRQNPGDKSFRDFKDRSWRKIRDETTGLTVSCAGFTTKEYAATLPD